MQNPQKHDFQTEELELVAKKVRGNPSKTSLVRQIQFQLSSFLNKNRTESQILAMLSEISNEVFDQPKYVTIRHNTQQKVKQPSFPLFKSFGNDFKDEGLKLQNTPMRKINPKRYPIVNYRSLRKIAPKDTIQSKLNCSLQDRLRAVEQINQQCTLTIDKFDRKLNKKISIVEPNSIDDKTKWFYNQYFYSNYDKKFFMENPLIDIISQLDIDPDITYKQHKMILKSLPKPYTFNNRFIKTEKAQLDAHRNICRQKSKMLSKHNQATDFAVHSIVLALHPLCGHLHLGSILAFYKENQYMVKFVKPELPTHKICDINMSTEFTTSNNKNQNKNEGDKQKYSTLNGDISCSQIVQQINFESTGWLVKLLALKTDLLKEITRINDKIQLIYSKESAQISKEIAQQCKKQQQWLFDILQRLQIVIKQAIIRFRLRGLNQLNSQTIFRNLDKLLINPLKIMSKQFDNSSDSLDVRASSQIKQIIKKQRQNQATAALYKIPKPLIQQMPINSVNALKCCLALLTDLKNEGKDFDLEKNSHIINLIQISLSENLNEHFNDIYEKLHSVVTKIRE